jgi:hypothetical protein
VFIQILEVHDYSIPEDSFNNDHTGRSDSSDDGYLGYDAGRGLLCPWPQVYWLVTDMDAVGNSLPSLPQHSGSASWPAATPLPGSQRRAEEGSYNNHFGHCPPGPMVTSHSEEA